MYKGEHQPVKYFALRGPYSRTKTMKFASQNPSIVAALHNHVMRFATVGGQGVLEFPFPPPL